MNYKKFALSAATVFVITLLVTLGVTFLWNLVFHKAAIVDWETSFRFATLLGIILPILDSRRRK